MILNILFWILVAIKNANFGSLSYMVLHLSNLYETIFALPISIAMWILLFPIAATIFDTIRPRSYRLNLLIGTLVFVFVNLCGLMSNTFIGSKQFDVIGSISASKTTYHLVRMDNDSCNNPPCEVDYWYRLYECDSIDISCQILFEWEKLWRWLGEPNKLAVLQSNSAKNELDVIVDDQIIYTDKLVGERAFHKTLK